MADRIQPTPRINKLTGLLGDFLGGVYDYTQRPDPTMPMGLANPVLGLLSNALPLRAGANVLDDLSYGQAPIRGTGMTTRLTPDATELAMAAAPFPKTSGKAALAALGAVDHGALNKAAIVWHGSPHKFDRLDASKIGTGEGAQAYGHGLYLAESPDVARGYATALARPETHATVRGQKIKFDSGAPRGVEQFAASMLKAANGDVLKAIELTARGRDALGGYFNASPKLANAIIDLLKSKQIESVSEQANKYFYKVDMPDNMIAKMLDWDKPLNQQPEVVNNALKVFSDLQGFENYIPRGERAPVLVGRGISGDTRGRDLYRFLGQDTDSKDAASTLRGLGVPGIRYLDGDSRGVGAGTSNFVVFPGEENALTILERNGRGLLD